MLSLYSNFLTCALIYGQETADLPLSLQPTQIRELVHELSQTVSGDLRGFLTIVHLTILGQRGIGSSPAILYQASLDSQLLTSLRLRSTTHRDLAVCSVLHNQTQVPASASCAISGPPC